MIKKISLNVLILFSTFFIPLYFQYLHQNDIGDFRLRQNTVILIVFAGAGLLVYLNYQFIKKEVQNKKWIWFVFEMIGIIGLLYSAWILLILYEFRHGIGF